MAQMAPLSFALPTFRPVLIRLWVVASSVWVAFKFCSATMAPTFVFTLFINSFPSFKVSGVDFDRQGLFAHVAPRNCRASHADSPRQTAASCFCSVFLAHDRQLHGQNLHGEPSRFARA